MSLLPSAGAALLDLMEERAAWARLGL